jgi:hypothetical protein
MRDEDELGGAAAAGPGGTGAFCHGQGKNFVRAPPPPPPALTAHCTVLQNVMPRVSSLAAVAGAAAPGPRWVSNRALKPSSSPTSQEERGRGHPPGSVPLFLIPSLRSATRSQQRFLGAPQHCRAKSLGHHEGAPRSPPASGSPRAPAAGAAPASTGVRQGRCGRTPRGAPGSPALQRARTSGDPSAAPRATAAAPALEPRDHAAAACRRAHTRAPSIPLCPALRP